MQAPSTLPAPSTAGLHDLGTLHMVPDPCMLSALENIWKKQGTYRVEESDDEASASDILISFQNSISVQCFILSLDVFKWEHIRHQAFGRQLVHLPGSCVWACHLKQWVYVDSGHLTAAFIRASCLSGVALVELSSGTDCFLKSLPMFWPFHACPGALKRADPYSSLKIWADLL